MLNSNTSVIDRRVTIDADHHTFPYEVGWALEATWFLQLDGAHPELRLQPQISPDGLSWVDHGPEVAHPQDAPMSAVPVAGFGGWLRLAVRGATAEQPATILTHLVLKG